MSVKSRNKKQYEQIKEQQWIEMEDLSDPHNDKLSRKFAQEQGKKYEQKPTPVKNEPVLRNQNAINPQTEGGSKREYLNNKQNQRKQPPAFKRNKKPTIPLMLVTCQYCTVSQNVPGNTQLYTCGSCENVNECEPLYGVFNCGNCQVRVCYGFGISIMIKCPKCKSINKVPSEAVKKYESNPNHQRKQEDTYNVEKEREEKMYPPQDYSQIQKKERQNIEEDFKYPGFD